MPLKDKQDELIAISPRLIKLIIKTVRYSKGGLNKAERQELGQDLLDLALKVLEEVTD